MFVVPFYISDDTAAASDVQGRQKTNKIEVKKNADGMYECVCGYKCGKLKNRLTNHMQKYCKQLERTVRKDIPCPVCEKEFTYEGLKSHIMPFTKHNRKHQTYSAAHSMRSSQEHKDDLKFVVEKYGPKPQK